jgi:hypothetical protein
MTSEIRSARLTQDDCSSISVSRRALGEVAGRELTRSGGNVSAAARALGVPTQDLRLLVYARPELLDVALEAEARVIEAEKLLLEAIRGDDIRLRIRAASLFLRTTAAGRRRGFR